METILLLRKTYLQKINKMLNTSLNILYEHESHWLYSYSKFLLEIAMNLLICGIRDKQFAMQIWLIREFIN